MFKKHQEYSLRCNYHIPSHHRSKDMRSKPDKVSLVVNHPECAEASGSVQPEVTQLLLLDGVCVLARRGVRTEYLFTSHGSCGKSICLGTLGKEQILALARGPFRDIEFHSVAHSKDRSRLVIVVGLSLSKEALVEEVQYMSIVLSVTDWTILRTVTINSWITPSVVFHPTDADFLFQFHISAEHGSATLQRYDVTSGSFGWSCETSDIDSDGDAMSRMVFSRDGARLIVLIIERLWYTSDNLCRIFAVDVDVGGTLLAVTRLGSSVACGCHDACAVNLVPLLSRCGSQVALQGFGDRVTHFKLPVTLDLRRLCRIRILKALKEDEDVNVLPLPDSVKAFLRFSDGSFS